MRIEMNSSPHVCCDVDNIIVYGSDARVYVLNSAPLFFKRVVA